MTNGEEGQAKRRRNRGRPGAAPSGASRGAQPTQARLLAVRVMDRVQRVHAYADLSLHHYLAQSALSAADRALATELVYGTLRWRGRIDYLLDQVLDQPIAKLEPPVASTLRVGAYQLMFTDRIPVSAAVDESVRCIRALGLERATGLVNAVMRRFAREHKQIPLPSLEEDPKGHLVHALSFPEWIAERWIEQYGPEEAARLARASNDPPPYTIRVNTMRATRDELLAELLPRFPDAAACPLARHGITLGRRGDPSRDPGFLAGRFSVQDEAAQLVVDLLDPQPGDLVLDACAAPGGKTAAIAERLRGKGGVLALDRNASRLGLVARTMRRLGLGNVHTLERDAAQPLETLPRGWLPEAAAAAQPEGDRILFDRVLVDAPCTGLGTLRRNPDARWRLAPDSAVDLARLQLSILQQSAACVKPGGCLVYSTCTLLPEENEELVAAFLQSRPAFRLVAPDALPDSVREPLATVLSPEGFMRCFPHIHDADGFFAARLERTE